MARYRESVRLLEERAALSVKLELTLKDVSNSCRGLSADSSDLRPKEDYIREHQILKGLFWETVFEMT